MAPKTLDVVACCGTVGRMAKAKGTTAKIQRRKAAADRKETFLRMRLTEAHKSEIEEAAAAAGIAVSAWSVDRLLKAARAEKAKQ